MVDRKERNAGARTARAAVMRFVRQLEADQTSAAADDAYAHGWMAALKILREKIRSGVAQSQKVKGGLGRQ